MKNVSRMLGGAALCAIAVMNIAGAANTNDQKPDDIIDATPCSAAVAITQIDDTMIAEPKEGLVEGQTVQIDYDEQTGKSRYSLDGGKTWSAFTEGETIHFAEEGDNDVSLVVTATSVTPAE